MYLKGFIFMTTHIASLNYHRTTVMLVTVLSASLWCQTKSLLADERACSYCPNGCQSCGTLLQWSYGTSFSGGPNLDEPLVTDRPDFTAASSTVGRGVAQLEFDYTNRYSPQACSRGKQRSTTSANSVGVEMVATSLRNWRAPRRPWA